MKTACPLCKKTLLFEPGFNEPRVTLTKHLQAEHKGYRLTSRAERRFRHKRGNR